MSSRWQAGLLVALLPGLLPLSLAGLPSVAVAATERPLIASSSASGNSDGASQVSLAARWRQAIANDRSERFRALLDETDRTVNPSAGAGVKSARAEQGASLTPQALVRLTDGSGRSALMVACKQGDLPLVRSLVALGADLQARTHTGGTPFMFAALGNHRTVAEWLLARGADLQAAGDNGWTASMIAAAKGYAELLDWLITAGADISRPDVYGFTPLMRAVDNQHTDAVATLLSAAVQADVNARDEAGNTALHHAVAGGRIALVEQLLAHGAGTDLANRQGQTALALAVGQPAIRRLLEQSTSSR